MNYRALASLVACGVLSCAPPSGQVAGVHGPVEAREVEYRLSRLSSPEDLVESMNSLFSTRKAAELESLFTDPDHAVALAAGWQRMLRTMPKNEGRENRRPDAQAVSRFLGLIEGRVHVAVPTAWARALKSAQGVSRRRINFSINIDEWMASRKQPRRQGAR
jgi:hypothetical protein